MAKIDLEKFVCALMDGKYKNEGSDDVRLMINKALEKQGLTYYDGAVVKCAKFKVGDFVKDELYSDKIFVIEKVYGTVGYKLKCVDGNDGDDIPCATEEHLSPWSVNDAKYGDILYIAKNPRCEETLNIIREWKQVENDKVLCSLMTYRLSDNMLVECELGAILWGDTNIPIMPATKEQRKMLFNRMAEEGYKWDGKELSRFTKFTPFEEEVYTILSEGRTVPTIDKTKKVAKNLLSLAREQIMKEIRPAMSKEDTVAYDKGFADGCNIVVPRWMPLKKGERLPATSFLKTKDTYHFMPNTKGVIVGQDVLYLPCDDLKKLPKVGI